uniref:Alkyl transferase n=1 Tax=Lilium longiflorum TaxID=4690 RepID=B2BA86_LILLO|nr:LLA-66 [Lilium longiflorum]
MISHELSKWKKNDNQFAPTKFFSNVTSLLRRFFFAVLSVGPMPRHIAFILDGNRRYGKKWKLKEGESHNIGFLTLVRILRYCCEMGVEYVTLYAFSIDNFNRKPNEVQYVMNLIRENTQALVRDLDTVNRLGVRVNFIGRLDLLDGPLREAARTVMKATAGNTRIVLWVCTAYTSTEEIVHGVQGAVEDEWARLRMEGTKREISLEDLEGKMYFERNPDPDILIRTSGETRLSNFVLWQTSFCLLYAPRCLWPDLSLRHLVWAVLLYQRSYAYLEKAKKYKLEVNGQGRSLTPECMAAFTAASSYIQF